MTEFKFTKIKMQGADLNGENTLPPIDKVPIKEPRPRIGYGEDRGLFNGYGFVYSSFPHKQQDKYNRTLSEREYDAVILENEFLRAVFVPSHGGKLWSLYDKKEGRDLFFSNPVVRYCNLAICNAWTSGGLEFNIGERGHHAYTVRQLFTAKTFLEDGTPVLRIYEYERVRNVVYQVDFFLPDKSEFLYCRVRIVNSNYEVVPMYWWSNAAIPKWEKGRIIVPAEDAYAYDYTTGMNVVPIPFHHGMDMSYFINNPCSDTFYNIEANRRKFLCYSDADGYAYAHASTDRLKSRKLFVWGNGQGGNRWQEYLSGNGCDGQYIELQAGIANTQSEHIPMPPRTAWEWVEAYGAVRLDKDAAHSMDYSEAVKEAQTALEKALPAEKLETILEKTREMAKAPAKELLLAGSGWGALENERRKVQDEELLPINLDFGKTDSTQKDWLLLLNEKTMGEHNPENEIASWMCQKEWIELMEEATEGKDKDNWYTYFHLACAYYANRRFKEMESALEKSISLNKNAYNLYVKACYEKAKGKKEESARTAFSAAQMGKNDSSLVISVIKILFDAEKYEDILALAEILSEDVLSLSRVRFYYIYALLRAGKTELACEEFEKSGNFNIDDIEEGEISITQLWFELEEEKAKKEGKTFDRKSAKVPREFDFRMNVNEN